MIDPRKKQIEIEKASEGLALDKYYKNLTDAITQGRFDDTKEGLSLMKIMFEPLNSKVAEYLGSTYRGHTLKTQNYIKLMSDDSREITYIVLKTLVTKIAQHNNKAPTSGLSASISKSLKRLHYFNRLKKDNPKLHSYLGSEYKRASAKRREHLVEKHIKSLYAAEDDINNMNDIKAGAQLIDIVLQSGIDIIQQTKSRNGKDKAALYISFTQEALDIIFDSGAMNIPATLPPMIVTPKEWTTMEDGGYIQYDLTFVKAHRKKDLRAIEGEDLSKVYPVVNKLQKTPWRVSKRVSDVIEYIFDNNLIDTKSPPSLPRCYGDIPTANVLEVRDVMKDDWKEYKVDATPSEKEDWHLWNKRREHIKIGLDGEKGRRLQYLLTINMMKGMKERKKSRTQCGTITPTMLHSQSTIHLEQKG